MSVNPTFAPATSGTMRNFGAVALANNTRFGLRTNPGIQSEMSKLNPANASASKLLAERQGQFRSKTNDIVGDGSNANKYLAEAIQKRDQMAQAKLQEQALASAAQYSQQSMSAGGGAIRGAAVRANTGNQANFAGGGIPVGQGGMTSVRSNIISTAKKYLGTPYVWGGKTPRGFDCSGLTKYVYQQYGINLPAWSNHQTQFGVRSHLKNARPGDLVGWNRGGHVGIYIGNGMLLHSPRPGRSVEIRRLSANEGAYAVRLQLPGD